MVNNFSFVHAFRWSRKKLSVIKHPISFLGREFSVLRAARTEIAKAPVISTSREGTVYNINSNLKLRSHATYADAQFTACPSQERQIPIRKERLVIVGCSVSHKRRKERCGGEGDELLHLIKFLHG